MIREVAWLFGRGPSANCGLNWVVPEEWRRLAREERVSRIITTLRSEMDASCVNTLSIRRFLHYLRERTGDDRHLLLTTNWDFLLQRELDLALGRQSLWPKIDGVFHLNGTVENRPAEAVGGPLPRQSPFLLEDPGEQRTETVEGNGAYAKMISMNTFVVIGMRFECQTDRFLLRHLRADQDWHPIGESPWIIVNDNESHLEFVCKQIKNVLPRATVSPVCNTFSGWQEAGYPGLEPAGGAARVGV